MNTVALILFIIAAALFLLASVGAPAEPAVRRLQSVAVSLGLCILTVGFIVQFCAQTHNAHF